MAADARHGGSSTHYADRHGTLTLIAEVPLWSDRRAADLTETNRTRAEMWQEAATALATTTETLGALHTRVHPHLTVPTPFRAACEDQLATATRMSEGLIRLATALGPAPATVAESLEATTTRHMLRLRTAALLRRQLAVEHAAGNQRPVLREATQELAALFNTWCAEAEADLSTEPFPLRQLVTLQVGAALTVVSQLPQPAGVSERS